MERRRIRGVSIHLCLLVAYVSSPLLPGTAVAAPGTPGAAARAEELFEQGRALIAAGQTRAACERFDESNRLDPAVGTLLNLAVCNERLGRLATAWIQFRGALPGAAGNRRRLALAKQHLARLEPRIRRLTIAVADSDRVPGLRITLDGVEVMDSSWNVATPIDPGRHQLMAEAPGFEAEDQTIEIAADAPPRVVRIALERAPDHPVAAVAARETDDPVGPDGASSGGSHGSGAPPSGWPSPRVLAYVAAGVGLAGLATGVGLGFSAMRSWNQRNELCPTNVCATPAGQEAQHAAELRAKLADGSFAIAVVALIGAGYLHHLSRSSSADPARSAALAPWVSEREAGMSWVQSW